MASWIGAFEWVVLVVGGLALVTLVVAWSGCALAVVLTGGGVVPELGDAARAVGALPRSLTEPRRAWPDASQSSVPSAPIYWASTGAVGVVAAALLLIVGKALFAIEDQRRLAPAFGGLLNDLIGQVYRHVARTGAPLDPPLLVVIDEAGNTPLRALPEYASTLAGLGVLLVTIWQSLAQIEAAYGRQGDTILTNHLSKVFYAGLSDPASLRYVAQVLGEAEVETRTRSAAEAGGRGSSQYATTRVALAPPHTLRQMRPGDALLVHGTLPPAHIRTRQWWRETELRTRALQSRRDVEVVA